MAYIHHVLSVSVALRLQDKRTYLYVTHDECWPMGCFLRPG